MQSRTPYRTTRVLLALAILAALFVGAYRPTATRAAPGEWRDTGLDFPDLTPSSPETGLCVDPTRPNTLVVPEADGTYTYDWQVGSTSRHQLNAAKLSFCNRANGLMYGKLGDQSMRFSLAAPAPQPIDHTPTHLGEDSSPWAYALEGGRLWASADGGLTWQQRPAAPARATSLTVAAADARVLYCITEDARPEQGLLRYTVWQSLDAGATWAARLANEEARGVGQYGGPFIQLNRVGGLTAPVGLVTLTLDPGYPGSSNSRTIRLSSDGGATWRDLATDQLDSYLVSLFYANDGLVKRYFTSFAISHDLGATFQPLADPPFSFNSYQGHTAPVKYAAQGPANLFTSGDGKLYHSPDSGQTWQPLGDAPAGYLLTPYAPFAVLGFFGTRLRVLDLPDADRSATRGTTATAAPGSGYATPTRHNIPAVFKDYWDGAPSGSGGLPQFGYPQTEAFREISRSDGKVYLVQYFERNRFEWHPENKDTPYEVLLGLLGNTLLVQQGWR